MFLKESLWIRDILASLNLGHGHVVVDIGSSTAQFRRLDQPFIDFHVFRPLRKAGARVVHVDARAADGVDVVCDIASLDADSLSLIPLGDVVICSNLLEHVVDRDMVLRRVTELTKPSGFLLLTVPFRYRWHADPIDTLFRPSRAELEAAVTQMGFAVVESAEIEVDEEPVREALPFAKQIMNSIYHRITWRPLFQARLTRNEVSAVAARRMK